MRVVDAMLSFRRVAGAPHNTALGASTTHALVAIARERRNSLVSCGNTLTLRETEFALTSGAVNGTSTSCLGRSFRMLPPIVIETTIRIGFAAPRPPPSRPCSRQPRIGTDDREARQYVFSPPLVAPGLALGITIIGFNLFGDGLRDRLGGGS
jgi:peptide/nickel transport system permease protein